MFALSLAQLRTQGHRMIATCLAIVIAVGFLVATLALNESSRKTVLNALAGQYRSTDTVVSVADDPQTQPSVRRMTALAEQISDLDDVAAVSLERSIALEIWADQVNGRYAQVESLGKGRLRWQELTDGSWPDAPGEVLATTDSGLTVGSVVRLATVDDPAGKSEATVVGLADTGSSIATLGEVELWATDAQVSAWSGSADEVDAIRVAARDGVGSAELTRTIAELVEQDGPDGLNVLTGEEKSEEAAADLLGSTNQLSAVLLAFAALAGFVCALVIANTYSVLLAQRIRELALLRAIGASSRQLRRSVLIEAFTVGLLASALGVLVGLGLAAVIGLAATVLSSTVPLAGLTVRPSTVIAGLGLGTVVTMFAAFAPARRATRVAPLAALRTADDEPTGAGRHLLRRAGVTVVALGGAGLGWAGVSGDNLILAALGGMLTFLAAVLVSRRLVPFLVQVLGRVLGPLGRVPGRLAASNATRNPQRTAATATALIIGVALTTTMVVGSATARASVTAAIDSAYPTDVVVATERKAGAPVGLADAVAAVADVTATTTVTAGQVSIGTDDQVTVQGVEPDQAARVLRSDDGTQVPQAGTILVPRTVAEQSGATEGGEITVSSGSSRITLTAHLVGDEVSAPRITAADLDDLVGQPQVAQIWARLSDDLTEDEQSQVLDEITTAATEVDPTSTLTGSVELRSTLDTVLDILLLVVLGLLGVAVVIAVIGIGNTMALSVLERRRESGVLRALGLTRGQLRRTLLWEAMLIAGVAAGIGVLLGTLYGTLGARAALGIAVQVSIPTGQLLAILLGAVLAGALASVLPARRAARTSPVEAIAAG